MSVLKVRKPTENTWSSLRRLLQAMHLCIPETRVSQKMSARINSRRYSVSLYKAVSMLEALDQFLKRPECNASDDCFFFVLVSLLILSANTWTKTELIGTLKCILGSGINNGCVQAGRGTNKGLTTFTNIEYLTSRIFCKSSRSVNVIRRHPVPRQPQCDSPQSEPKVAKGHPFCSILHADTVQLIPYFTARP